MTHARGLLAKMTGTLFNGNGNGADEGVGDVEKENMMGNEGGKRRGRQGGSKSYYSITILDNVQSLKTFDHLSVPQSVYSQLGLLKAQAQVGVDEGGVRVRVRVVIYRGLGLWRLLYTVYCSVVVLFHVMWCIRLPALVLFYHNL